MSKSKQITIKTYEIYMSERSIIKEISIGVHYVTENDSKAVKRVYDKQREFEDEFEALMSKYDLKLKLPF